MILYILKSGACLATFFLFYKLFLEKENMHLFKRFYLLTSIAASFLIPFITFTSYVAVAPIEEFQLLSQAMYSDGAIEQQVTTINYIPILLWSIYGLGVLFFGIKFLYNISNIIYKIQRNPKQKTNSFINVLLNDLVSPHTFFNYIFLNKYKFESKQIPEEVFIHEQTHAKQKHSLDILLIEVLQVIFWFNPLIYFTKKAIKLNHEFLADQAVLNNGVSLSVYQKILLTFSSNTNHPDFANAINYSSIKKRFTIMKTTTSSKSVWLRSLVLLPLLTVLIYGFSEKKIIEQPYSQEVPIPENISIHVNSKKEIFLNKNKKVTLQNLASEIEKIVKPYKLEERKNIKAIIDAPGVIEMGFVTDISSEIRKSNINIISLKAGGLTLNSKSNDTVKLIKNWYITIDGKKYYYTFNNKIAKYYDASGKEVKLDIVKEYNKKHTLFEQLKNTGKHYVFKSEKEKKEMDVLFSDLGGMYFRMPKSQKNSVPFPNNPRAPYVKLIKKTGEIEYKKRSELTEEDKKLIPTYPPPPPAKNQDGATKKQLAEYNKLAKHYNSMSKNDMVIKLDDMKRLRYIYNLMTEKQKKNAEAFPNFPPPPPPAKSEEKVVEGKLLPPPPPIPTNATPAQKEKYKKAIENYERQIGYTYKTEDGKNVKIIEGKRIPPPPPPIKSDQGKIIEVPSKNPPPPPPPSQKTIEKGSKQLQEAKKKFVKEGELYAKAVQKYRETRTNYNELESMYIKISEYYEEYRKLAVKEGILPSPPPPPTPIYPTDLIIGMAKKGAIFYYEDKKITSDKALDLTKKNKNIHMKVLADGSSMPIVKLSKN